MDCEMHATLADAMAQALLPCALFFQAEGGIRDYKVTGVQTCALPIYPQSNTVVGNLFEQTQQLLALGHTQAVRAGDLELVDRVEDLLPLLRRQWRRLEQDGPADRKSVV